MKFFKIRSLLTYLLILISFGCSNFNLQQSGSIAINFPETESKTISRTAPTQEESDNRKVTTYLVILSSNKIGNIEKEVGPGEKIEFTDLPEGEYSIYCVAKIVDTPHFGDEANVTVTSGQTSTVELQLKPVVSIDFLDSDGEAYTGEMAWLGRTIIIPKPNISKIPEGYTLEYWTTIVDGEVKNYYPGESFTLTSVEDVPSFSMKLKEIENIQINPEPTQLGWIAYDDMTTSKNYNSSKTAIGIVVEVIEGYATKIMHLQEFEKAWCTDSSVTFYETTGDNDGYRVMESYYNEGYNVGGSKSSYGESLEALRTAENLSNEDIDWYVPGQIELLNALNTNKSTYNLVLLDIPSANVIGTATNYWSCSFMDANILLYFIPTNNTYCSTAANTQEDFSSKKTVRYFAHFVEEK